MLCLQNCLAVCVMAACYADNVSSISDAQGGQDDSALLQQGDSRQLLSKRSRDAIKGNKCSGLVTCQNSQDCFNAAHTGGCCVSEGTDPWEKATNGDQKGIQCTSCYGATGKSVEACEKGEGIDTDVYSTETTAYEESEAVFRCFASNGYTVTDGYDSVNGASCATSPCYCQCVNAGQVSCKKNPGEGVEIGVGMAGAGAGED